MLGTNSQFNVKVALQKFIREIIVKIITQSFKTTGIHYLELDQLHLPQLT